MKRYIRFDKDISDIPDENKNGDCFVVAFNNIMHNHNYLLVHGVVTGRGAISGIEYCHAWVETDTEVIDDTFPDSFKRLPKEVYYSLGNVKFTKKYTYRQALEEVCKYETYGPWDMAFRGYP